MANFTPLSGAQTRQLFDTAAIYDELRRCERLMAHRFPGSLSWKTVSTRRYLYRKRRKDWVGLGPESTETNNIYRRFHDGRDALRARIADLDQELQNIAPVNRAMGLGRIDLVAARILRRLEGNGALGHGILVAGTHALFAYERMGAIAFGTDLATTADIDLLYDARGGLDLIGSGMAETGLLGLLQAADHSFAMTHPDGFRAANARGFMVDLITPAAPRNPASRTLRRRIGDGPDMAAAEIDGLVWLENAPRVRTVVLDEKGFPLSMVVPDPRAFACHKAWLSERPDREPGKARRDLAQARAVATMVATYLPAAAFDDRALSAIPMELLARGPLLIDRSHDLDKDWR